MDERIQPEETGTPGTIPFQAEQGRQDGPLGPLSLQTVQMLLRQVTGDFGLDSPHEEDSPIGQFLAWKEAHAVPSLAYLDERLPLYGNYVASFGNLPYVKPILLAYMHVNEQYDDTPAVKVEFGQALMDAGVPKEPEVLEFLLLIAEKLRNFDDRPNEESVDAVGRYYFEKYRGKDEKWHGRTFRHSQYDYGFHQKDFFPKMEAAALRVLAVSRADEYGAIVPTPRDAEALLAVEDNFFRQGFRNVFRAEAPISLREVTRITTEETEEANNVSNRTYIDRRHLRNPQKFAHFAQHEGLHLCFDGFDEMTLEEAVIEYYRERMFIECPRDDFGYAPTSEIYGKWKGQLKLAFELMPGFEEQMRSYVLGGPLAVLRGFAKQRYTNETGERLKDIPDHLDTGFAQDFAAFCTGQ